MSFRFWFWPTISAEQYRHERESQPDADHVPERPLAAEELPLNNDRIVRLDAPSTRAGQIPDPYPLDPASLAGPANATRSRLVVALGAYKARLLRQADAKKCS